MEIKKLLMIIVVALAPFHTCVPGKHHHNHANVGKKTKRVKRRDDKVQSGGMHKRSKPKLPAVAPILFFASGASCFAMSECGNDGGNCKLTEKIFCYEPTTDEYLSGKTLYGKVESNLTGDCIDKEACCNTGKPYTEEGKKIYNSTEFARWCNFSKPPCSEESLDNEVPAPEEAWTVISQSPDLLSALSAGVLLIAAFIGGNWLIHACEEDPKRQRQPRRIRRKKNSTRLPESVLKKIREIQTILKMREELLDF